MNESSEKPLPSSFAPVYGGAKPFVGHIPLLRENKFEFFSRLRLCNQALIRLKRPFGYLFLLNTPELVHEVLVEKAHYFEKTAVTRYALYPLAGEGLFTSEGELWRRQRKRMAPLFKTEKLRSYAQDMVLATKRLIETWRGMTHFHFSPEATRLTMTIAGKTLFDTDTFSDADDIGKALMIALEWANSHLPSFGAIAQGQIRHVCELGLDFFHIEPGKRISNILRSFDRPHFFFAKKDRELLGATLVLDRHVKKMVSDRRQSPEKKDDLLSRLLLARDEDGSCMSDKEVRDEILTLFVAGHETTSIGLSWTIYELCRHPEIYDRVQNEVDTILGTKEKKRLPCFEDLPSLPLCSYAFKEALRLYPPVYVFGRQATREVEIGGYLLPKRSPVLISPYLLHFQKRSWASPQAFNIDRFLPEEEKKRHKLAWMPFSAGPRFCIGNHFSMMEATLVLATLLSHVRFYFDGEDSPDSGVTLRPKKGIPVRIEYRA